MVFNDYVFVGIDPTTGRKDFAYAALDNELNLVALADADTEYMLDFLGGYDSAVAAVNAPSQVNRGLVKKKLEMGDLSHGRTYRGVDMRLVEYELRTRGIAVAGTPSRQDLCPAWMQVGFAFYRKLSRLGYKLYDSEDGTHQWLETHPYACFCAMLEQVPFPKPTLEGRLQRQIILHDKGLRITDPMDFFQEITRFKLMKGILPTEALYSPDQLDVLAAAYTAWLAVHRPDEVIRLGERSEGQMVLPVRELKEKY